MNWDEQQAGEWLHWWHQAYWQQADASWGDNGFYTMPPDQQQQLAWQHPQAVAASFGILPALPPEPEARLLTLVVFSSESWQRLLELVAGICMPQSDLPGLSAANRIWCRRLSKALRCESWFPQQDFPIPTAGSLLLLRSLHPESWPRLRLSFPQSWVRQSEILPPVPLPTARLAALWDAAIWQIQQTENRPDVDN